MAQHICIGRMPRRKFLALVLGISAMTVAYSITLQLNTPSIVTRQLGLGSRTAGDGSAGVNDTVALICDRKEVDRTYPCLCYVDVIDKAPTDEIAIVSGSDSRIVRDFGQIKCAMQFFAGGRLGNVITQYATLFGLAEMNRRPAFMSPNMGQILKPIFKLTMPVMSEKMFQSIRWTGVHIQDVFDESYRRFDGQFLQLHTGVPNSFPFYDHLRDQLRREFTLQDHFHLKAQSILRELRGNRPSATFVGVHVRRGDYVRLMTKEYRGVMADKRFFDQAMAYYRNRYSNSIFVVVSNEMKWCQDNIPNERGDIYYVGNNNETDPLTDLAILVSCNHSIFTIGTYGHWAAYIAGGEVVYFANFTAPDSVYRKFFKTGNTFLSHWIPIQADLSPVYNANTTTTVVPPTT